VILSIHNVLKSCSHLLKKSLNSNKSSSDFISVKATCLSAIDKSQFSALANNTFSALQPKLVFQLQLGPYIRALIL